MVPQNPPRDLLKASQKQSETALSPLGPEPGIMGVADVIRAETRSKLLAFAAELGRSPRVAWGPAAAGPPGSLEALLWTEGAQVRACLIRPLQRSGGKPSRLTIHCAKTGASATLESANDPEAGQALRSLWAIAEANAREGAAAREVAEARGSRDLARRALAVIVTENNARLGMDSSGARRASNDGRAFA